MRARLGGRGVGTGLGSAARILLAVGLLALAVVAVLLARDLRSWPTAIDSGDTRFIQAPGTATWTTATVIPFDLAERILGLRGQVAFRNAAQSFVAVRALGQGLDNGYSETQTRDSFETVLVGLSQGPDRVRDSEVENMLGILAYADSQHTGSSAPAPVERAVADFQDAVQLDPGNDDAKFNLEWLLNQLLARGIRPGSTSSGGPPTGRKGAGSGSPGRGY